MIFINGHGLIIDDEHFIYYNFDGETVLQKKIFAEKLYGLKRDFHHLMSLMMLSRR